MTTDDKPKTNTDINAWMITRGINANMYQQYRKETKKYGHTSKGFSDEFIEWYCFRCDENELKVFKERVVLPEFKGDFKEHQLKYIAEYQYQQPIKVQDVISKEEIGEMKEAIQEVKKEIKKEATIDDYKIAYEEAQKECNDLYNKVQVLQDALKQQCDKVVRSVEIVEHNANEHEYLKFLYDFMNDKMVIKSQIIKEWREEPENKDPVVITEGSLLLRLQAWEKDFALTQDEINQILKINDLMKEMVKK